LSTNPAAHSLVSEPFRIAPQFDHRVWGWTNLAPWFAQSSPKDPIGEAWLTGDECIAETGPWAGHKLGGIFAEHRDAMLGSATRVEGSPLLVKILFAREKLSVQVHPDDAMAQKYGFPRGKTECWYALAADPGALAVAPVQAGRRGNPLLLSRALFAAIARLEGDEGARRLLREADPERVLEVEVEGEAATLDVDTPAELDAARNLRR